MSGPRANPSLAPLHLTLGGGIALLAIQGLCLAKGVPFVTLVRDPAAHLHLPHYVGFLSSLGCVGWGIAAALGAFGWWQVRGTPTHRDLAGLLGFFAVFSAILGLDDLAQLHEEVYPLFLRSEKVVFLIYGVAALAWLLRYRTLLMARVKLPLLLAIGCFAASIVLDQLSSVGNAFHHLMEDGPKLLGILNWIYLAASLVSGALVPRADADC